MRFLVLSILLLNSVFIQAQTNIDSLWAVWDDSNQPDTNRYKALRKICWDQYLYTQPDSAFFFASILYDKAIKTNHPSYAAQAINLKGASFFVKNDLPKALELFEQNLAYSTENDLPISGTLNNLGIIYRRFGDLKRSIEYYSRSLKLDEESGRKSGIASSLNNIAGIYDDMGELDKALDYYQQAVELSIDLNQDQRTARIISNIGDIYTQKKDFENARKHFDSSIVIQSNGNDQMGLSTSYFRMAYMLIEMKDFETALMYNSKSSIVREELGFESGGASILLQAAFIKQLQGKNLESLKLNQKGLRLAEKSGSLDSQSDALLNMSEIYKNLGNYRESLSMYEKHIILRDSMENEESEREIIRQEYKYTYEKQAAADSIKAAEEVKVKDAQLAAEQAENNRRKQQSYFLYSGLILALIFGGFIFNRYKVTNEQKEIISEQKGQVDLAYSELEEKNQKIIDSINYAKRIQNAILPPDKELKKFLKDSFIIYLPKDVVAGDFYWLESSAKTSDSKGQKVFFAAADCTGHGVPGAMVSVICNNGLNRSVREHGLTDPGKILDKTREIVVKEFEKSEEEVKDGMDIALCALDGNTLEYAGAHNPLVIIRKDAEEAEVIKPNKQPIGQFDNPQPYMTHKIKLNEGDSIYLFSDGFQDQFGGPKGKKFMISRFKKLLVEVSKEQMDKQQELILKTFNDWKGKEEQIDDVCVIGVRV